MLLTCFAVVAKAQQYPNGDFKKWDAQASCPAGWSCNNDEDCNGKVTMFDKVNGGVKLTVQHCFNPLKDGRSNNVNISCDDDMSSAIAKGKKVKVVLDYTYNAIGADIAYIKIDVDFNQAVGKYIPAFIYNDEQNGNLKSGNNMHAECYLNFTPGNGKTLAAPQSCNATSIRTALGIMPALLNKDVHKGSMLIIQKIRFEVE